VIDVANDMAPKTRQSFYEIAVASSRVVYESGLISGTGVS
jgi:hypothetical protein